MRKAAGAGGAGAILGVAGRARGDVELYRGALRSTRRRGRCAAGRASTSPRRSNPARAAQDTDALEVAGDALAAASDEHELAEHVVRLALAATGAARCVLWRLEPGAAPTLLAARRRKRRAAGANGVCCPFGEPPVAELELVLDGARCGRAALRNRCAARAAVALRRARRGAVAEQELERSETIVEVVSQAIARLSLAHTLDTAVERVAELLGHDASPCTSAGRGPQAAASRARRPARGVAERLLELALGPLRAPRLPRRLGSAQRPAPRRARDASAADAASAGRSSSRSSPATR